LYYEPKENLGPNGLRFSFTIYVRLKFTIRRLTDVRLTKFTKSDGTVIIYTYDASGYRTSKTVGDKTTKYYYGHNGHIIQEDHDRYFINYKYDASGICGFDLVYMDGSSYNTEYFHYVNDLLGNVKYILDNNGNIMVKYTYSAFLPILKDC